MTSTETLFDKIGSDKYSTIIFVPKKPGPKEAYGLKLRRFILILFTSKSFNIMAIVKNKALILKKLPNSVPVPGEHLVVEEREFDTDQEPPEGGIIVRNHYVSFDPYQRGRMRDASIKSYSEAFELGGPVTNFGISSVLRSRYERFQPGTIILTDPSTPTEEYSILNHEAASSARQLQNPLGLDMVTFLGPLGMPGLTAYSSFYEIIGTPRKGDVMFISAASGAVGQVVGQLAKREGLKVIGSVGDDRKLDFIINELGFDAGFDYKKEKPTDGLRRTAPNGINIYYENVGGEHLEAALDSMNNFGKISTVFSVQLSCERIADDVFYQLHRA